jgi:hypothetical protein
MLARLFAFSALATVCAANMLVDNLRKLDTSSSRNRFEVSLPAKNDAQMLSLLQENPEWYVHWNFDGEHLISTLHKKAKVKHSAMSLLALYMTDEMSGSENPDDALQKTDQHVFNWKALSSENKDIINSIPTTVEVDTSTTQGIGACSEQKYVKDVSMREVNAKKVSVEPVCGECAPGCEECFGTTMDQCLKCTSTNTNGQVTPRLVLRLMDTPDICVTHTKCTDLGLIVGSGGKECEPNPEADDGGDGGQVLYQLSRMEEMEEFIKMRPITEGLRKDLGENATSEEEERVKFEKNLKDDLLAYQLSADSSYALSRDNTNDGNKLKEMIQKHDVDLDTGLKIPDDFQHHEEPYGYGNDETADFFGYAENMDAEDMDADNSSGNREQMATDKQNDLGYSGSSGDGSEFDQETNEPSGDGNNDGDGEPSGDGSDHDGEPSGDGSDGDHDGEASGDGSDRDGEINGMSFLETGTGLVGLNQMCSIYDSVWKNNVPVHRYAGGVIFGYSEGEDPALAAALNRHSSLVGKIDAIKAATVAHSQGVTKTIANTISAAKSTAESSDSLWCQGRAIVDGLKTMVDNNSGVKVFVTVAKHIVTFLTRTIGGNRLIREVFNLIRDVLNWIDRMRLRWDNALGRLKANNHYVNGFRAMCDFSTQFRKRLSLVQGLCHINSVLNSPGQCGLNQLVGSVGNPLNSARLAQKKAQLERYAIGKARSTVPSVGNVHLKFNAMRDTYNKMSTLSGWARLLSSKLTPFWNFLSQNHRIEIECYTHAWVGYKRRRRWSGAYRRNRRTCLLGPLTVNIQRIFNAFGSFLSRCLNFLQRIFQPIINLITSKIREFKTRAFDALTRQFNTHFNLDNLLVFPALLNGFDAKKAEAMSKVNDVFNDMTGAANAAIQKIRVEALGANGQCFPNRGAVASAADRLARDQATATTARPSYVAVRGGCASVSLAVLQFSWRLMCVTNVGVFCCGLNNSDIFSLFSFDSRDQWRRLPSVAERLEVWAEIHRYTPTAGDFYRQDVFS